MKPLSENDIIQATCAVLAPDGSVYGTAWLVSHDGHLLTAGHLLGKDKPRQHVQVQFPGDIPRLAHSIGYWGYQREMGIDYAVLQLDAPLPGQRPLPVVLTESVIGTFKLRGYGKSLSDQSGGKGDLVMG